MNRRNLFKMLGAMAVSAVCAPLAKLLAEPRPRLTINAIINRPPAPGFRTVYRRQRLDAMIAQADRDLKAVQGLYARTLEAEMREDAAFGLKVIAGA